MSSTWVAHVTFTDSGEGLLSITSPENRDGTLSGKLSRKVTSLFSPAIMYVIHVSNSLKTVMPM